MNNPYGKRAPAALTALFIAIASLIGIRQLRPPAALPASAPANEFSGIRALNHLRAYAHGPHPIGTAAQDAVRQYIVSRLSALGVTPEVYTTPISRDARSGYPLATGIVHDIIARVPGSANSKELVLMGHYDSVPGGPGAADDGEGVSVMLETLRALRTGPQLKNDVVFLFTDGEESGLLGARAFADAHAPEVGLALDFESRGTSGPGMMFSTSKGNGWLVHEMAKASPYPVANSLSYEVYQILPNETDLTTFKQAGIPCMDFAFIGDITDYHTRLDDPDHIDPRSLQHQGSYALSLARHFGNLDLRNVKADDVTYFNFPLLRVVIYPIAWSLPLAVIAAVLLVGAIVLGLRLGRLTVGGTLLGFVAFVVAMAASIVASQGLWKLVCSWHPGFRHMMQGDPYHAGYYRAACTAAAIAVFAAIFALLRRRTAIANLWAGAMIPWLALAIVTAIYLPGASYVFTWPLIGAIVGLAIFAMRGDHAESWGTLALLWICCLPAILLIAPMIDQLFVALTMALAAAPALFTALLLGLLIPLLDRMVAPRAWWLAGAAAVVCVGYLIAGSSVAAFSRTYPEQDSLFYGLDADTGKAMWFSGDAQPGAWTEPVLSAHPQRINTTPFMPFLKWPLYANAGAAAPLPAPRIERLDDNTSGGVRTLRLHVVSPRLAHTIFFYGDPRAEVLSANVNGKSVGPDMRSHNAKPGLSVLDAIRFGQWSFEYEGAPKEGFDLTLQVKATGAPLDVVVIDQSFSLDGVGAPAAPEDTMSIPWVPDSVFVRKSFSF